jgi:hypothetical protein
MTGTFSVSYRVFYGLYPSAEQAAGSFVPFARLAAEARSEQLRDRLPEADDDHHADGARWGFPEQACDEDLSRILSGRASPWRPPWRFRAAIRGREMPSPFQKRLLAVVLRR